MHSGFARGGTEVFPGEVLLLDGDEDEVHSRWEEQHVQRSQTVPMLQPVK